MRHGKGAYAGGTYHEVEGEGPAVVLAGGGPGVGHAHYHPWFSRLADRHRVVYFDYLGTGRSARGACSIEAYAEQVEALRAHLGLDTLSLIGISFGGMPALAYALAHPERVERLVLSSAQVGAATWREGNIDAVNAALRGHFPERWRALLALRERGVRSLDPAYQDLLSEVVHRLEWADPMGHARLRHDEPDRMDLGTYGAVVGEDPEWEVTGTMASFDALPELHRLRVPTLVVSGRWDGLTTPAIAERVAGALAPGLGRLVLLERSAHRPWAEEPDAYFATVAAFLSASTTTSTAGSRRPRSVTA